MDKCLRLSLKNCILLNGLNSSFMREHLWRAVLHPDSFQMFSTVVCLSCPGLDWIVQTFLLVPENLKQIPEWSAQWRTERGTCRQQTVQVNSAPNVGVTFCCTSYIGVCVYVCVYIYVCMYLSSQEERSQCQGSLSCVSSNVPTRLVI